MAQQWRGRVVGAIGLALAVSIAATPTGAGAANRSGRGEAVDPGKLVWAQSAGGAPGAGNLNGIATDGRRFVAVGLVSGFPPRSVPIWTSTDGLTWRSAKLARGAFPASTVIIDVVWQGKRFLAFGEPASGTGQGTLAWSSRDGLTWKRYKPKGFPVTAMDEPVAATGTKEGLLLLVGNSTTNGYSLWSSRADHWKSLGPAPATGAPSGTLFAVQRARGRHRLVVAGTQSGATADDAAVWHSRTGASWSAAAVEGAQPDVFSGIKDLVPVGSALVAVGVADGPVGSEIAYAWRSTDGSTWSADRGSLPVFMAGSTAGQGMDAGVSNGKGVLAVGHDGGKLALWSSRDGTTWARVADKPTFSVGSTATASGVAIARGRVVTLVRVRRFNGQSFDLVGLAIIAGHKR